MLKHRPLIGVTGPSRASVPSWFFIQVLVWWAGGRTVHIKPDGHLPKKPLAGLILGGGADIDPALYKEKLISTYKTESNKVRKKNHHFFFFIFVWVFRKIFSLEFTTQKEDKKRDELEFRILSQAVKNELPILGICRGAQLINVFFGGTLHQEIAEFYTEQPQLNTILPKATILIDPQSRLYSILGKRYTRVNSLHHQSVKTVGKDVRIVAQEPSGIVEAIEHTRLPFVIGVQWHPEFLLTYRRQRRLFKALISASRRVHPVHFNSAPNVQVSA
jgi:putative glutamine amidotransferase